MRANQGKVWVAHPSLTTPSGSAIHLVGCAAYPRCQNPTEEVAISRMFRTSLDAVAQVVSGQGLCGGAAKAGGGSWGGWGGGEAEEHKKVLVITHALGSFLGHNEPELFGRGLATGFRDFLAERRA